MSKTVRTLFRVIDDLASNGNFEAIDEMIQPDTEVTDEDIEKFTEDHAKLLLAILTSTLPMKDRLSNRTIVFSRAQELFSRKYGKEEAEKLLYGLE
jgi:hypothetical protein